MLRDKNLVLLSHQHQHALALCVLIRRGTPAADAARLMLYQQEIDRQFAAEISQHFLAEEQVLFPAAAAFPQMQPLIEELLRDHQTLREYFRKSGQRMLTPVDLLAFAEQLSAHVRKEEDTLFESCQQLMSATELARIGDQLRRLLAGE